MILVPEEKYLALQTKKDIEDENVKTRSSLTSEKEEGKTTMAEESQKLPELDKAVIISAVPKPWQNKARSLLQHIKAEASHDISWDRRGTVSINGVPIPNSHISDLINYVVKPRKGFLPMGHKEFYDALIRVNIPMGLVSSSQRQQMISREPPVKTAVKPLSKPQHPPLPPPPGQPIKRKRKTLDWIKFE